MPIRSSVSIVLFFALFLFAALRITPIYAQQPASTPSVSAPTSVLTIDARVSALEDEMFKIETAQTYLVSALTTSNEQYRYLLTAFGGILAALVIIQGFVTSVQLWREGKRDSRQVKREDKRDEADSSVEEVSKIMKIVRETIDTRLDAEITARAAAKDTGERLEKVLGEVQLLDRFFRSFQANIKSERKNVDNLSDRLAQTPRHEFRQQTADLSRFAQRFDTFKSQFEPLAEESQGSLSAKALYIRGIAAHYASQPEITRNYLAEVTGIQQPELGEPEKAFKRRMANAYFYLGVTESNFGKHQRAVDSFDHAIKLDPENTDFLTKIVTAEAYFMKGTDNFPTAENLLLEVDDGLHNMKDKEGNLTGVYLRLQSRAALIRANMIIVKREEDWESNVRDVLNVCDSDPTYYYATATLAQALSAEGNNDDAKRQFQQSYETIKHSGDLLTVTEVRSRILLLMVAGLCCRRGGQEYKRSDEHLDRAEALLGALPKIDEQVCTVFSTLTKRNEKSEIVREHLDLIRKGKELAEVAV